MTISTLSYANNFGEWFVSTNALIINNNTLETGNYTKLSGTLYINSPNVGLQVNSQAIFSNTLISTGNTIVTDLSVSGNTTISNCSIKYVTANSIVLNGRILYNCTGSVNKSSIGTLYITASDLYTTAIINFNGVNAANLYLPTANSIEAVLPVLTINTGFDYYIMSTAGQAAQLIGNTGITMVGNTTIFANTSAHFRMRRTAANTYTTYRLS